MAEQRLYYVLLLAVISLLHNMSHADESVRLLTRSSTSPLTSSTLRWVHGLEAGKYVTEIVKGAALRPDATDKDYAADGTIENEEEPDEDVEVTEVDDIVRAETDDDTSGGSVIVCRARHNGDLLPGSLVEDKCIVSLAKQVVAIKRYDVLRNVEGAARLQWRKWTRFNGQPLGAVSADGLGYVARRHAGPDARQTHYMGRLDLGVGLGRVYVTEPEGKAWVERDYQDGEVLIELEPVRYELVNVQFNERRVKLQQRPRVLATTVLRREKEEGDDDNIANNVATALTYWNEPSSEYWGQGRGMLRGLETSIHLPGDTRVLAWGVNATHPGSEQAVTVQAALLPDTALNVSVTGNHTQSEIPYTARLVAQFRDGKTRIRTINGTMHQVSLQGVKVEYGSHYFLHDGSLVPTTTTTTTTPPSTTTSTTTTTTTPKPLAAAESQKKGTENGYPASSSTDKQILIESKKESMTSSASRQNLISGVLFILLFSLSLPCRTGT